MNQALRKTALAVACASGMAGAMQAEAANWTMLQGTEPSSAAGRIKMWGFVEATYQKDTSKENKYLGTPGNNYRNPPPALIGPDLDSQSGFNIRRARLGARGEGFPLDSKVNYFLLAEFGNNAITHGDGSSAKLTDASITLNHIKGARVRVGAFKVPTFEEGYQAIHVFDYVNFTEVANQMMLERFPNHQATLNRNNVGGFNYGDLNQESPYNRFEQPVGAFRDVGVQVFDMFKVNNWEHTYAIMVGNGNGVNFSDNDSNKDRYLYWSSELVFGGAGPFRDGLKLFAWSQSGKRTLYNPATPWATGAGADPEPAGKTEYDRKRAGVGVKYKRSNYRVTAEYLKGEGMIFLGPDNPSFTITAPCVGGAPGATFDGDGNPTCTADGNRPLLADGRKGKANGWYLEGGYKIPNTNWEVDARYDVYNRLTDAKQLAGPCAFEFTFKTKTLGVQYHFNKKTRLTMNAAFRDFEDGNCPAPAAGGNPNNNLSTVDKRYGVQLRHVF